LNDGLCLLDNNKYCNRVHRFCMLLRTRSMWRSSLQVAKLFQLIQKLIMLQFLICCNWIQNKNQFRCVTPTNWSWSGWYNNFANVVIGCLKLPPLCCRGYFIIMLNRCSVLSTRLCIQPLLLGWLLRCQKLIGWRYLWPFKAPCDYFWHLLYRFKTIVNSSSFDQHVIEIKSHKGIKNS
jgi:hypothetical protein